MIIDANMYWFPEEIFENDVLLKRFLSEMPGEYGWHGCVKDVAGESKRQIVIEKPEGYPSLNYIQGDYRLEKVIADMDLAKVDRAVLKLPGCHEWMSLDMCCLFNDMIHRFCERGGGRFFPLATIPPIGSVENLEELDRCRNKLGMRAIQLSAHVGDSYLDDPQFADFFARVNELEMTVYIHHTPLPTVYGPFIDYDNLRRTYGRCVDQGLAVSRELFSGFFSRYPNLKVVHSMLGGGFFAFANMMFPSKPKQGKSTDRFETMNDSIREQFRESVFFEMSHAQPWGKDQLECAIKVLGADHVIFGTSYPVRKEWLLDGPAFIESLSISDAEKKMILCENAERLYHLKGAI